MLKSATKSGLCLRRRSDKASEASFDSSLATLPVSLRTSDPINPSHSELQYGEALRKLTTPRESYILQTKVRPMPDKDDFRRTLDRSLSLLGTHLDLFGFHGINRPEHLEWVVQPGGCLEVVQEYQEEGRIRFVGFSTHAPTPLIVKAIDTGIFDYVNLHYHAIGSYTSSGTSESPSAGPGNWEAIEAAHRHDMGVFIISAADKGGGGAGGKRTQYVGCRRRFIECDNVVPISE